jgi:hypothetical protein
VIITFDLERFTNTHLLVLIISDILLCPVTFSSLRLLVVIAFSTHAQPQPASISKL